MSEQEQMMKALLERIGAEKAGPAEASSLAGIEATLGFPLPEGLRALWAVADGAIIPRLMDFRITSAADATTQHQELMQTGQVRRWQMVPLTEHHTSNYFCVITTEPLTGIVAYVPHDDRPRIAFPSVHHFLAALADEQADHGFWDAQSLSREKAWFARQSERNNHERQAGRSLLKEARATALPTGSYSELSQEERNTLNTYDQTVRFGTQLLSDDDLPVLKSLMDVDEISLRAAHDRLKQLSSTKARAALARYEHALNKLASRLTQAALAAGLAAEVIGDGSLIRCNGQHLAASYWYPRRDEPNIAAEFINQFP